MLNIIFLVHLRNLLYIPIKSFDSTYTIYIMKYELYKQILMPVKHPKIDWILHKLAFISDWYNTVRIPPIHVMNEKVDMLIPIYILHPYMLFTCTED